MKKLFRRLTALMCTVLFIFGAAGCAVKSDKQKEELNLKFQHTGPGQGGRRDPVDDNIRKSLRLWHSLPRDRR